MDEKDLIQAIRDASLDVQEHDNGAMTSGELAESAGLGQRRLVESLKSLVKSGYVEVVYVKRETLRTPITGKLARVPGYRLTEEGKKSLEENA